MRTPFKRVVRTPLLWRGSLKPSILAPTWLARFETPSAHGRGGAPPLVDFVTPKRLYFQRFFVSGRIRTLRSVRGLPGLEIAMDVKLVLVLLPLVAILAV